jgi:hypothetical protein
MGDGRWRCGGRFRALRAHRVWYGDASAPHLAIMPLRVLRPPRAAALVALLVAGRAAGQNADGVLLGMDAATTGGAVVAVAGDAAVAFYNPAGLALVEGPSVQFSASAYSASSMRIDGFVATALPWESTSQSVRTTSLYSVPAVAAYGLRLRPGLGVAAGFWAPSHEEIAFSSDLRSGGAWSPGGSVTSATYEQHLSVSQKLDRTYFGVAAGLAVSPRVRVGLSGFVTYDASEDFVSLFAVALTDSPAPQERGGALSFTSSGAPAQFALRFGAGAQWDVAPWLTLAVAAKTPSFAIARRGGITSSATDTVLFPGVPPDVHFVRTGAEPLRLDEPWRVAAGGAAAVGAWSVRAEADWQARISGQRAVANARLGALHGLGDVRWGAGLFTDRGRDVAGSSGLAVDYYGATAGVSYRPPPVRAARARGGTWDVWTTFALRYAYGTGTATGLGIAPLGGAAEPPSAPVRVDTFTLSLGGLVQF